MTDRFFVSVAEVAEWFGVSKMTVNRMVHAGELPAVRVSRNIIRIPIKAVHEYADAHQMIPDPESRLVLRRRLKIAEEVS